MSSGISALEYNGSLNKERPKMKTSERQLNVTELSNKEISECRSENIPRLQPAPT
jgi:hypothetical protein